MQWNQPVIATVRAIVLAMVTQIVLVTGTMIVAMIVNNMGDK